MCATCGCGQADVRVDGHHQHDHQHDRQHDRQHDEHDEHDEQGVVVDLELAVLAKNDHLAAHNRARLAERGVLCLNLMSSPGAGKTTLLCRTIDDLGPGRPVAVVEGDQETQLDAARIRATGAPVVQINTGSGCHLDAAMLARGLERLDPARGALEFVENVGNLVCPALFDLGEAARVVIVSVTEGEDKPLKYPQMFAAADLVLVNKVDLLPHLDLDLDALIGNCRSVNPGISVLATSATSGAGMRDWYAWLGTVRDSMPDALDRSEL